MYYLLIVAAAGFNLPADNVDINQVALETTPNEALTAYDQRRISYKVREWQGELGQNGNEMVVWFGNYDNLDACKAARAEIRIEMINRGDEQATRSGCFQSRDTTASVAQN